MATQLTAAQRTKLEAELKEIDWQKVDWARLAMLVFQIVQAILAEKQPMQGKALEHCDHEACCLAVVCATGEAFQAATDWSPRVGVRQGVKKLYQWLLGCRGMTSAQLVAGKEPYEIRSHQSQMDL